MTASGANTAKVFNFAFGIPSGESGTDFVWESYGGYTHDAVMTAASAGTGGGVGWRERKHSNGTLELEMWDWFTISAGSTLERSFESWPSGCTPFVTKPDGPIVEAINVQIANGINSAVSASVKSLVPNTSLTFSMYATNANSCGVVNVKLLGYWKNIAPPSDGYVENHALDEAAFAWNGVTYYPVTDWTVSASGAGGDSTLCAAVRFLMGDDSSLGQNHIICQYAAFTKTGAVNTSNGYMLIRKLNSAITTYENTAGVKARGEFFSTLDTNQRQGYVYDGEVHSNLIWGDQPYIVTDCGAGIASGTTVTSKTFYVAQTSGSLPQTSISASYTTPTS